MENIRKWIILFIAVQFAAVGAYILFIVNTEPTQKKIIIGIVSIFLMDAFFIGTLLYQLLLKEKITKKRLKLSGISAMGEIIHIHETSIQLNKGPVLLIEIEVNDAISGRFSTKIYRSFSAAESDRYKIGKKIAVLYNATNINEVVIDD